MRKKITFLSSLSAFLAFGADLPSEKFDVVIVGGSSSGVGAAIGAGRLGVSVALLEDTPVLGGMLANGISNIDAYSRASMSGVFEEFRRQVKDYYADHMKTIPDLAKRRARYFAKPEDRSRSEVHPIDRGSYWGNDPGEGGVWEPEVADRIFKKMVAAYPNVKVFYGRFATGIVRVNRRIAGVVTEQSSAAYAYAPGVEGSGKIFYGKAIVDATHEGDIAAWAGAPYRVGREARSPAEPHAGEIYVQEQAGELVIGSNGRQDAAPAAYVLRMSVQCGLDPKDRSHLLQTPPGYDRSLYTGITLNPARNACPGSPFLLGKAEWNGSEFRAGLDRWYWQWSEATRDERRKMYEAYKSVALGYLYFLQQERGYTSVGLPKTAWPENGNLPYRVFTRECRRILGDEILNEENVNAFIGRDGLHPPFYANSIALAHYPIDAKPIEPKRDDSTPESLGNGNMYLTGVTTATQIPYGAILPQRVEGLLVPTALSATHVAFSSIRQDPFWVVTGQAAGVAAALSAKEGVLPRKLPVEELQAELLKQKCKLVFYYDVDADHPQFQSIQRMSLRGIVGERADRTFGPDEPLTRGDAAVMLVKAFDLWPSVTHSHFDDVSFKHPAFQAVETLCDNGLLADLGFVPIWRTRGRFDAKRDFGYQSQESYGNFEPDKPVTAAEFAALIRSIEERGILSPGKAEFVRVPAELPPAPQGALTRAIATQYLESVISGG